MPIEIVTSGNPKRLTLLETLAKEGKDFAHRLTHEGPDPWHGGVRYTFTCDNGWGASVICNEYSYGGTSGLFEMAVLGLDQATDFDNPVTDNDPSGWLTESKVVQKLRRLVTLTPEDFEAFAKWKDWRKLSRKVEGQKAEIQALWEEAANLYHSEDEPLPIALQASFAALDEAFEQFRVPDPGIPVDEF